MNKLTGTIYYVLCIMTTACATSAPKETPKYIGDQLCTEALEAYKTARYHKALFRYQDALVQYSKIDSQEDVARTLNNIAVILHSLGKSEDALKHATRSLTIYKILRDDKGEVKCRANRALILRELGKNVEAGRDYSILLEKNEDKLTNLERAIITSGLAHVKLNEEQLDDAEQMANESLKLYTKENHNEGISSTQLLRAKIFRKKGNLTKAKVLADQALELDRKNRIPLGILNDLKELGAISEGKDDRRAAIDYYKRALKVAEALELDQKAKELNDKLKTLEQ